ncbi:hypothetical protein FACS1894127_2080 [Clostridia bacterium]|nr:hypothetical protein FACS1894127_2080 [Clostridia bacterium]
MKSTFSYGAAKFIPAADFKISKDATTGRVSASTSYINTTGAPINVRLLLAVYDGKRRLISMKDEVQTIDASAVKPLFVELDNVGAVEARAFIWDANTYVPLVEGIALSL